MLTEQEIGRGSIGVFQILVAAETGKTSLWRKTVTLRLGEGVLGLANSVKRLRRSLWFHFIGYRVGLRKGGSPEKERTSLKLSVSREMSNKGQLWVTRGGSG